MEAITQGLELSDSEKTNKQETLTTPLIPINGFPEPLQDFINEYVKVYNIPRDYIVSSVLFSTGLAIGNKFELKGKYDNIPLLWMAIVGNVSSGKTDPLRKCLNAFFNKDKQSFKKYQIEKNIFDAEMKEKKGSRNPDVLPPQYFQYLLNDYTPEALYKVHTTNNRGVCIYRDELKGWLDDFGRYTKSGEQSTMLSSFYRQPMQINRVSKEPIFIHEPTIYVCGGIQPDVLQDLAKDSRAENGFLSRLIFAYPDLSDKQPYSNEKLNPDTLSSYESYLNSLIDIPETIDLTLSNEAEEVYSNWYNKNVILTNKEPTGYLKGVYGKLDVISLRIAIIVHGMEFSCDGNKNLHISPESMHTAIEIIEYFRVTALKVYGKIFKENGNFIDKKRAIKSLSSSGASQNKIADVLGVSQPYVNRILKEL